MVNNMYGVNRSLLDSVLFLPLITFCQCRYFDFYLRQEGNIFANVRQFVCLSVREHDYAKHFKRLS